MEYSGGSRFSRARPACRRNAAAGGLPGRANATIRSPAASIASLRSGLQSGAAAPSKRWFTETICFIC